MRRFLRFMGYVVAFVISAPGFSLYKISRSMEVFTAFGELYSLLPGKIGIYSRAWYYHMTLRKCPLDINIWMFSKISYPTSEIGKGVLIGSYCSIGLTSIGDNSVCSSKSSILSGRYQHNFNEAHKRILEYRNPPQKILIGENAFVGEGSIIMGNIGDCCIIGAGSVVVNEIKNYSVAVGNPARIVKKREKGVESVL